MARRGSLQRRNDLTAGYLFIAPQVLGVLTFVIAPLGMVVWFSLHEWEVLSGSFTFVGTQNYARIVEDPATPAVAGATAAFCVGLVALNLSLALVLALLLNERFGGRMVLRTLFFSPVVVSMAAWVIVWRFMFLNDGAINSALKLVGVTGPNWLREGGAAMVVVIFVQSLKNVGLNMVLFLSALQGVPSELYAAAAIDGAGARRRLRHITLPMISPTILLTSILTVIGALQVFALISIMTQGGPGDSTMVLVYYLYQQAFEFRKFGYGSAWAVVLFLIVFLLTVAQWQMRKKWVFHEE